MARRVLVIDDDPTALRLISYTLEQEGYDVTTASNGRMGLSQARELRPDVIILDVMMPDLDGFEVSRQLRADPLTAQLPILMLTAKGQVSDKVAGFHAGADDYVVKPADPGELIARVGALMIRASYAQARKARVISFVGAKGGVGTTTVAVNVGVHMAKMGRDTAFVELRGSFGTGCLHLNLRPRASLGRLFYERENRTSREIVTALMQHTSGLKVLAGPQQPDEYVEITPVVVSSVIDSLAGSVQSLILDMPVGASPGWREALERSDFIAMVTEQEPASLASAKMLLALMKDYGISPASVGGVIVHRARSAAEMSTMQVSQFLELGLLGVIPTAPEECASSLRLGSPLVVSQASTAISAALVQVADRLGAEQVTLQQF